MEAILIERRDPRGVVTLTIENQQWMMDVTSGAYKEYYIKQYS